MSGVARARKRRREIVKNRTQLKLRLKSKLYSNLLILRKLGQQLIFIILKKIYINNFPFTYIYNVHSNMYGLLLYICNVRIQKVCKYFIFSFLKIIKILPKGSQLWSLCTKLENSVGKKIPGKCRNRSNSTNNGRCADKRFT